jgi:uncharacterized protein YndB with AHSA1/START domain
MDVNRTAPVVAEAHAVVRAPLNEVWRVQTDIAEWPRWNREVARVEMRGPLAPGTTFRWKAGGAPIVSTIKEVVPERRIVWTGRTLGTRAVHVWAFEPHAEGTLVRTVESFDGLLARLLAGYLRRMLTGTLQRGLAALQREAERRSGGARG